MRDCNFKTSTLSPEKLLRASLRSNRDQHQISPGNTNAYSTPEVMRIKDMITQGEFFHRTFIRKVREQDIRICSLTLRDKGSTKTLDSCSCEHL